MLTEDQLQKGVVISLCDLTGKFVAPWVTAGCSAVLVDPQQGEDFLEGSVLKLGRTILEAMPVISELIRTGKVVFVAGFPPCTDVAVSGARWFEEKTKKDKFFQSKAALIAEQCRMVGEAAGVPWFFENPVSVFSSIFGKPDHSFHPWYYTGHAPEDNYTKKTCLWSGGGFIMPERNIDDSLGKPDDRIHKCPPSEERANIRSATPRGFAEAVFLANAPHLKGTKNA